jgi:hypothetical protein
VHHGIATVVRDESVFGASLARNILEMKRARDIRGSAPILKSATSADDAFSVSRAKLFSHGAERAVGELIVPLTVIVGDVRYVLAPRTSLA